MSVVNKMLNDLDKRKANSQSTQAIYQTPEKSGRFTSHTTRLLVLGLLIFGVSAYTIWYVFFNNVTLAPPASLDEQDNKPVEQATIVAQQTFSEKVEETKEGTLEQNTEMSSNVEKNTVNEATEPKPNLGPKLKLASKPELEPEAPLPTPLPSNSHLSIQRSAITPPVNYQTKIANALAQNDYNAAKLALGQWVNAEPDALEPRKKLASLMFADGEIAQAQALLNETLAQFPENVSVRLMLSRLLVKQNNLLAAWQTLLIQTENTELLHLRASLARQLDKFQQALDDYDALLILKPQDLKAWLGSAVVSDHLGANNQAVLRFNKVQTLADSNSDIARYATSRLDALQKEQSQ